MVSRAFCGPAAGSPSCSRVKASVLFSQPQAPLTFSSRTEERGCGPSRPDPYLAPTQTSWRCSGLSGVFQALPGGSGRGGSCSELELSGTQHQILIRAVSSWVAEGPTGPTITHLRQPLLGQHLCQEAPTRPGSWAPSPGGHWLALEIALPAWWGRRPWTRS